MRNMVILSAAKNLLALNVRRFSAAMEFGETLRYAQGDARPLSATRNPLPLLAGDHPHRWGSWKPFATLSVMAGAHD